MGYGISPLLNISEAYIWKFDNLDDAKEQALKIAQKHHVDVIVFQIIGTYKPATVWSTQEVI